MTIDSTNVYWTNQDGTVMQVAIGGGTPTTLATGQDSLKGIAVDSVNVYWANSGSTCSPTCTGAIMSVPIGGGTTTPILSGVRYPNDIAVDGLNVYWTQTFSASIMKSPLQGGSPISISSGLSGAVGHSYGIVIDAANVYWRAQGTDSTGQEVDPVMLAPLSGGAARAVAYGQPGGGIMTDGTNVYWNNTFDGIQLVKSNPSGTPITILASQTGATGIAVDGTSVYWTASAAGMVMKLTPK